MDRMIGSVAAFRFRSVFEMRSWRTDLLSLRLICLSAALTGQVTYTKPALSEVAVRIELSQQAMHVDVNGVHYATWAVSTARLGYRTPVGTYAPYLLERMHYSKLYDYTPMPYSIFFLRGYAIHGTTEVRSLGRPVSHGCVRLKPENAKILFDLIGKSRTAKHFDIDRPFAVRHGQRSVGHIKGQADQAW